ncbi:hypothetical protein ACHQM5_014758 [Ranunculus cassubicifolius]
MMDARVGGGQGQRSATSHGDVVDGSPRTYTTVASQQLHQQQQQSQIGTVSQLLAGGIPGVVSKTCTAPFSRLAIILQVQGMHCDVSKMSKPCMWREAQRIVAEEGFRAFWRGNLVTLAHRLPSSSVYFYTYERYKHSMPGLESHFSLKLLGGGLAGVTAASVAYPLDLVRARLACQTNIIYYRGIGHTLSRIVREEGVLGLYKGLGPTLLNVGPSTAITMAVCETLKSLWHLKRPQDSTIGVSFACGGLAGIVSSTATFPLDLVRRRMQLEGAGGRARVYNTGLLGTFKQIIKQEGLRGLYRGILAEYCKVVPSAGIVFMTYEMMKILLADPPKEA